MIWTLVGIFGYSLLLNAAYRLGHQRGVKAGERNIEQKLDKTISYLRGRVRERHAARHGMGLN